MRGALHAIAIAVLAHVPPSQARGRLHAAPLAGPFPSPAAACAAVGQASSSGASCASTPLDLPAGAPFTAVVLRVPDTSDPRSAGSGAFFLALGCEHGWFVAPKPLDQDNGAAGHRYFPDVTPVRALGFTRRSPGRAGVIRLRDRTSRVCDVCTGPERTRREPVQTRALWLVCGLDRANQPACAAPLEADERTRVSLAGAFVFVLAPDGTTRQYVIEFGGGPLARVKTQG